MKKYLVLSLKSERCKPGYILTSRKTGMDVILTANSVCSFYLHSITTQAFTKTFTLLRCTNGKRNPNIQNS